VYFEIIDDETVAVGSVGRIAVVPKDVPADDDMETGFGPARSPARNAALAPRSRWARDGRVVLHGAITMVELNSPPQSWMQQFLMIVW
jgi:hypothetical protein